MATESDLPRSPRPVPAPKDGTIPEQSLRGLAGLFHGLGDRSRLHILFLLARHGELNVARIAGEVGRSQPAVSHHLTQLNRAGLVEYRRDGKYHYYRLTPGGLDGLIADLFPDGAEPRLCFGAVEVTFRKG
jgi:DNA-binding transcriptional ArsR family regulator